MRRKLIFLGAILFCLIYIGIMFFLALYNAPENTKEEPPSGTTVANESENIQEAILKYYTYLRKKNYELAVSQISNDQLEFQQTTRRQLAEELRVADSQSRVTRGDITIKSVQQVNDKTYKAQVEYTYTINGERKLGTEQLLVKQEKESWKLDFSSPETVTNLLATKDVALDGQITYRDFRWFAKENQQILSFSIFNNRSDQYLRIGLLQPASVKLETVQTIIEGFIEQKLIPPGGNALVRAYFPKASLRPKSINIDPLCWVEVDGVANEHIPSFSLEISFK